MDPLEEADYNIPKEYYRIRNFKDIQSMVGKGENLPGTNIIYFNVLLKKICTITNILIFDSPILSLKILLHKSHVFEMLIRRMRPQIHLRLPSTIFLHVFSTSI